MNFTVGQILVLIEAGRIERHATLKAHKTLGMEIGIECRYEVIGDSMGADFTLGCQLGLVAGLAVGARVDLEEAVVVEGT